MLEWLFQWVDKITQHAMVNYLATHIQWVDWFAALFFILGVIYGIQNGLLAEVAEIAQIMGVIYFTFEWYPKVESLIRAHASFVPSDTVKAAAYIATGLALWIIAALIFKFMRRFFHAKLSPFMKVTGGALLGGFHLLIIFSFLSQALILMPYRPVKKAFDAGGSYTGRTIADLSVRIHGMIAKPGQLATTQPAK